jgi:threonine dehydrogenase-like Zn-dependent dehydrogenase
MGADEALDPTTDGSGDGRAALEGALAMTDAPGLDMWVEASGAAGVVEWMTPLLAPGGKLVLIGRGPHRVSLDPERLIVPGASIHGSIGHSGSGAFGRVIALMAAGRLPMDRIVTDSVALADAVKALGALAGRATGKYLVLP